MAEPFPGGVRDQQGLRAFLSLGAAGVVAIDLHTGRVLWRKANAGRPVAATGAYLSTLAREGEALVLCRLDAATGASQGQPQSLDIPTWAAELLDDPAAFQMRASRLEGQFRFDWEARQRHSGGAASLHPPDPLQARGAVLAPDTGGPPQSVSYQAARSDIPTPTPPAGAPAGAELLAQTTLGARAFALRLSQDAGPRRLLLEATDCGSAGPAWTTTLDEVEWTPPRPPRP